VSHIVPSGLSPQILQQFVLNLADDELMIGHRDSEWTGYAPILEEDIAFSNIAQDEIGHSLVWFTLYEELTGIGPDAMAFKRKWNEFTCCRFVEYPKGDFAYTVVRQFLFDVAEQVRLNAFLNSSYEPLTQIAERLLKEESYHRLHLESLLTRLGSGTSESARRMQAAVDVAFHQSLGMFEVVESEQTLISSGTFKGNKALLSDWLKEVIPVLGTAELKAPVQPAGEGFKVLCEAENGGRNGNHTAHLKALTDDLQKVFMVAPESPW
jgi:ring-1,2-phenylacetyl-CoA epoxidase subunit PaaC